MARFIARFTRYLSIVIAGHGVLLALFAFGIAPRLGDDPPEVLASFAFFVLYVPASALTMPLNPILWRLHLIEAPGWFTWPKPLGYVFVYAVWSVGLLVLSLLVSRAAARN